MNLNRTLAISGAAAWLLCGLPLSARGADIFSLDWYTVDCGGGVSSGGQFTLAGSIGQPDVEPQLLTGGNYVLTGGFYYAAPHGSSAKDWTLY